MKRKLALVLMLVLMLLMLVPFEALAQEIVDDTATAVGTPMWRTSFYAHNLYWEFYNNAGVGLSWRTSADGTTWSAPTSASMPTYTQFDLAFDGTYIHCAVLYQSYYWYAQYRGGNPNADGTITWTTAWYNMISLTTGYAVMTVSVSVDSNGYPYFTDSDNGDSWHSSLRVWKSTTTGGLFTKDYTYGTEILSTSHSPNPSDIRQWTRLIALSGGKMAALYYTDHGSGGAIKCKRWTGSGWGSESTSTLTVATGGSFSAVAQDDDVHIVGLENSSNDISYMTYSYSTNSFSAETTIYGNATSTSIPSMSMDNANNLHVFWENDPTDDHMYYAKYIYDESTWVSYYDLIDEIDDLPATGYYLNTDYTCDESRVGVYYIADSTILKFKLLDEVFHVDTLTASPIGATTATLRGEIVSLGFGSATERGFWINDSPSLSGATQEGNETGTFNVGVFTHGITGLTEGDKYYYIAYASNDYGLEYGTWSQFTAGGSAGGIAVLTLDPTDVGDFEATFNGEIVSTGGDYLTMRGFQWGFSDTPTWLWDEGGNFTVGTFSYTPTDLEADSIYYVRAIAGNGTDTDYGQWVGFITEQPSYQSDEETEIGNSSLIPPLPGEPGGWIRPPKDWGNFVPGIPWTTVMWLVLTALVVLVGFALTKYAKSLAFLFIGLGFIIGVFSFFPKGGYLDWWIMFPYILVSWALISRQSERPLGE